jgi:uncharacterized protein
MILHSLGASAPILVSLAAITFLAFVVKGATGFGPALVLVSLGSLVIGPVEALALVAILDLASGGFLMRMSRGEVSFRGSPVLACCMGVGALVGALTVGVMPVHVLKAVVATAVIAFGVAMLYRVVVPARVQCCPLRPEGVDRAVAAGAGISAGMVGVAGPALALYFGSSLAKETFRATVVPMLLAASLVRVLTYAGTGLLATQTVVLFFLMVPALLAGLFVGNACFSRAPEHLFRAGIAVLVTCAGAAMFV